MAWKKGESGNPLGRPPNGASFTSVLRAALEKRDRSDRTALERIALAITARAVKGDLEAAKWIADRVDGRVPQSVSVDSQHSVTVVPWLPAIAASIEAVRGETADSQDAEWHQQSDRIDTDAVSQPAASTAPERVE